MRIDLYTKVVLTVIAISLAVLAIQPYALPKAADAQRPTGVMDVRIRGVEHGRGESWQAIYVDCPKCR